MSVLILIFTLILPVLQQDEVQVSQVRLSPADQPPPPFPSFGGFLRRHGVEGQVRFRVGFDDERVVVSVSLESANLRFREIEENRLMKILLEDWERVLKEWRWGAIPLPGQALTVEYRIDTTLTETQRAFFVEYGREGFPIFVRLVAPPHYTAREGRSPD